MFWQRMKHRIYSWKWECFLHLKRDDTYCWTGMRLVLLKLANIFCAWNWIYRLFMRMVCVFCSWNRGQILRLKWRHLLFLSMVCVFYSWNRKGGFYDWNGDTGYSWGWYASCTLEKANRFCAWNRRHHLFLSMVCILYSWNRGADSTIEMETPAIPDHGMRLVLLK